MIAEENNMEKDWIIHSKKKVLEKKKFCTVEYHAIELPGGLKIDDWIWIDTPDFVNAVVVDREGRFVMMRQTKYGIEGLSLAPVGGFIEPGEDPLTAAQRETMEEIGYESSKWISLGSYRVDSNRGCGYGYMYLALEAEKTAEPDADDLEEQEIVFVSESEVESELFRGGVKVMPWANNIALALLYLRGSNNEDTLLR